MAAGEVDHPAVKRGVGYLLNAPREPSGRWVEPFQARQADQGDQDHDGRDAKDE